MKLLVVDNEGTIVDVLEGLEEYDLSNNYSRAEIIDFIRRTLKLRESTVLKDYWEKHDEYMRLKVQLDQSMEGKAKMPDKDFYRLKYLHGWLVETALRLGPDRFRDRE